jgi:hypothetical protein
MAKDLYSCLILQLPRFFASPWTVRSRSSLSMTAFVSFLDDIKAFFPGVGGLPHKR